MILDAYSQLDDIAYVVKTVISAEEAKTGSRLDITVREDRLRIFRALQKSGVFTLKRAVPRVAEHFGLSRATIYSYLNEITELPRRVEPLLRRGPD